nr:LysM domain protein [uncultured bacterium]
MGLFDKMFGRGATAAHEIPNAERRFAELKLRYAPLLEVVQQEGVRLENLHVQENKLFMKGVAPSEGAKNHVWDRAQQIGPDDLLLDIRVEAVASAPALAPAQTYTVKSGDTLSKISKHFYGDANEYMRIFYANRALLHDPDKIQVGQKLVIPADTDD